LKKRENAEKEKILVENRHKVYLEGQEEEKKENN